MNRWLERTILLNAMMLILFVIAEYGSTMSIANGLSELNFYSQSGDLTNLRAYGKYTFLTHEIDISGDYSTPSTFMSIYVIGSIPNFTILLFIVTIILNILLVSRMARQIPPKPA